MTDSPERADKIVACRLWSRPGRDGSTFLSGFWGGCRVLVVANLDRADDTDATHLLVLGPNVSGLRKPKAEQP